MKQVSWTKDVFDLFVDKAMLSEEEVFILDTRIKGMCITQQAMILNKSESTIHRMIASMKKKYDCIQKEYPGCMPIRRKSAKEKWMDSH